MLAYNLPRKVGRSYVVLTADTATAAKKPMLYDLIANNRDFDHLPNPVDPPSRKLVPAIRALLHRVLHNPRGFLAVTHIRVRALFLRLLWFGRTVRLYKGRNSPRCSRWRVSLEMLDLRAQGDHFRLKEL